MKKLIRLLSPLIVDGVLSARRNSHDRVVEKFHDLQFVTRGINVTTKEIVIDLQILDFDLLYRLLAGEANRFFLASRVSHERSTQDQADNASWQAVEHYYSAYYAVHYLLRLTGVSVTNLEQDGINVINRSNYGAQPTSPIPGGLYIMRYDDSTKILTLRKNLNKKGGGSHHEAWKLWDALVDKLQLGANADPVEYARTSIDLAEHKKFLLQSTAKYNPPEIRGAINYQFKGGVWVFEKNAKDKICRLQRTIIGGQSSPAIGSATPEGLISNNKIIIGLAKAIFLHGSERYPKGICRSLANKYSSYVVDL